MESYQTGKEYFIHTVNKFEESLMFTQLIPLLCVLDGNF